jgi:hypothetical protein
VLQVDHPGLHWKVRNTTLFGLDVSAYISAWSGHNDRSIYLGLCQLLLRASLVALVECGLELMKGLLQVVRPS